LRARYRDAWFSRRLTVWIATVAIIFQSFIPLLHHPVALATGDLPDGFAVLCTPDGLKTINIADLGDEGQTSNPQEPRTKTFYCPICLSQQVTAAALVSLPFEVRSPDLQPAIAPVPTAQSAIEHPRHPPQAARAPPVLG